MGFKYDEKGKFWWVSYSKRHPITRQSTNLRRSTIDTPEGRRKIKTKAEARRVYAALIVEVERKITEDIIPTWPEHIEDMILSYERRGLAGKTRESYYLCLKAHTFDPWFRRTIDTITTDEIRELIRERVGHKSPSHQKNLLKFIRAGFNHGVEKGLIQRNPVPKMKFKIGAKIKTVLTEEQVRILLEKAKECECQWYPHWAMAVYTGMRNGELYACTWDKVNFENRQILVDSSWNNKDGFKSTKSGDDRMIEIAPNLMTILKQLKLEGEDSNFVLPRIDKWDKGEQARELRMFLQGIGLPIIRFHDLRATWATLLLSKGIEPIKVMIMGGWKDLKTMQFYVRKAGVEIKGITDCLDLHNPSMNNRVLDFSIKGSASGEL